MSDNPDCHYGDHDWATNGYCKSCGRFNAGWLRYQAYEKAEREGRDHNDHYHNTIEAKEACKKPFKYPDDLAEMSQHIFDIDHMSYDDD